MGANRCLGLVDGLAAPLGTGSNPISTRLIKTVTADANYAVTVSDVSGGLLQFTGLTAGRNLTMPTGVALDAAFPEVGVREAMELLVSIVPAFALTLVTNTGITLAGRATVPASSSQRILLSKTGVGTWTATAL